MIATGRGVSVIGTEPGQGFEGRTAWTDGYATLVAPLGRQLRFRHVRELTMFGGLSFMIDGNMLVGVIGDELMARVGADGEDEALDQPHTRPMDFTGRPMTGFVMVAPEAVGTVGAVRTWVERAARYISTLPPK